MFPIGPIIEIIGSVLNKVIPNADDRAKAQEEITRKLIENEAAIYDAMKTVMAADAASDSWMTRNARPAVVFWCLGMMTWLVISPAFGLLAPTIEALKAIPSDMWSVVMISIGGYILGKSGVDIAKVVKGKQ